MKRQKIKIRRNKYKEKAACPLFYFSFLLSHDGIIRNKNGGPGADYRTADGCLKRNYSISVLW